MMVAQRPNPPLAVAPKLCGLSLRRQQHVHDGLDLRRYLIRGLSGAYGAALGGEAQQLGELECGGNCPGTARTADSDEAAILTSASASQPDLFGTAPHTSGQPSAEIIALVRGRLHATLALVKSAPAMPWPDQLAIIREDNAFRYGKDILPPAEGAALWAKFDAEVNRLYAIMNQGKELDLGD